MNPQRILEIASGSTMSSAELTTICYLARRGLDADSALWDEMRAACKAFMDLFSDSDMRPEDECHELADRIQRVLAKCNAIDPK